MAGATMFDFHPGQAEATLRGMASAVGGGVGILGLFETGNVDAVPGVATAAPGHLQLPGGTARLGDAIRRGLLLGVDVMGAVDWFEHADQPMEDVRTKLGVVPKSPDAISAGSRSADDPDAVFGSSN